MSDPDMPDIENDIAVIGISCRFPGARSVEEYWRNIADGKETIRFFSDEELEEAGVPASVYQQANYVKANSMLEDIDCFDASFFGYTPRQAELMDPQQRLFLETAWETLESAGYAPERYAGRIGVFAGQSWESYLLNNLYPNRALVNDVGLAQVMQGNKPSNLTTRTSYKLNLTGPSMTIMTACSTSLVAVATGCQSLLNFQCDIALTGGVCIKIPQITGYQYETGGMVSPDGHCRTFDASADGTVFGNGLGLVALRRLEDALEDNDEIYAVIKGYAVNNDGSTKAGFTAPSVEGQSEVIVEAMASADVDPRSISLLEAHGTGTFLGDPIEIEALTQAFRSATADSGFCAIGSVKTNIGHMDSAAGIAGLIKAVLALKHRKLPPSLHYREPNPRIDFEHSPFYVNTELRDWEKGEFPRRAGVSSLGVGGTNAHVILQEAPRPRVSAESRPWQILTLSAKTASGLDRAAENLAARLERGDGLDFADAAFTLNEGRTAFAHRRVAVCRNAAEAIGLLSAADTAGVLTGSHEVKRRSTVFLFPGQGAQYINMGRDLYRSEVAFRKNVDYCADFLRPLLGFDLRAVLYPDEGREDEAGQRLKQTSVTQPALFVIEYALAEWYADWGIRPQAMIGHSIGEYAAATLAGVFSLDDALALVAERGRLMQEMAPGTMLAVPLPADDIQAYLDGTLSIATVNTPSLCAVSGPDEEIQGLEERLRLQGVEGQRLNTSHAFHSAMMEPALEKFRVAVGKVDMNAPAIPVISNLSGTWLTDEQATDADYWAHHLRHAVLFSQGVQHFLQDPDQVLLEVGPGSTLSSLARKHVERARDQIILASMRHPKDEQDDLKILLTTLGKLWLSGIAVDWRAFYANEDRHRVPLPTYPFERKRFWIDPPTAESPPEIPSYARNPNVEEWFYLPSWKRSLLPSPASEVPPAQESHRFLLFVRDGFGARLADRLKEDFPGSVSVIPGTEFAQPERDLFSIDPRNAEDYRLLFERLAAMERVPDSVLHLWSLGPKPDDGAGPDLFARAQEFGFYSMLFLSQALIAGQFPNGIRVIAMTNDTQDVSGEESLFAENATLLSLCKVLPQEHPDVSCRGIDITIPPAGSGAERQLLDRLTDEVKPGCNEPTVAYRGSHRWTRSYEPVRPDKRLSKLKNGGVYLITGGMGMVGLMLARHLATRYRAKIALLGRTALPPREDWEMLARDTAPAAGEQPGTWVDDAFDSLIGSDCESRIRQQLGIRAIDSYPGLEDRLNRLCLAHIREFFAAFAMPDRGPGVTDLDALAKELGILPKFRKFLAYFLHVLDEEGLIEFVDGKIAFPPALETGGSAREIERSLVREFPRFRGLVRLIDHCAGQLPRALTGEIEAISVLYPDGSADFLKQCSDDSITFSSSTVYETLAAELLDETLKRAGRKLKILEIGAGQGKLTWQLASRLKDRDVEYYFSDIGKSFVLAAQKEAEERGLTSMKFGTFDICADPSAQGFGGEGFDIVIGLNVVHATRDIVETLANLKTVLAPDGRMILLEGVRPFRWLNMIWGLAEGWWYFDDDDLRRQSPLLTTGKWAQAFRSIGFDNLRIYSEPVEGRYDADFALIVAGRQADAAATGRELEDAGRPRDAGSGHIGATIDTLLAIENLGSEVFTISADVADSAQMQTAIARIQDRYGRLDGVIHAAMDSSDFTLIKDTTREICEAHFRPKVHGLYALEASLRDVALDFCILLSSNAAVLGGHTLAAYAAANRFMDAFACDRNRKSPFHWLSTNWDRWLPPDDAVETEIARSAESFAMTPGESLEAFECISAVDSAEQIIVSAGQLGARLDKWIRFAGRDQPGDVGEQSDIESDASPAATVMAGHDAPGNEIEREIAGICQDILGVKQLGIHDSFLEFGGDSLIFLQIATRLRKSFDVEISFRDMFEMPTVAQLAEAVVRELASAMGDDDLEKMIAEIGDLSAQELRDSIEAET